MIITWVRAWGTTQCGQGQPQIVVPVEDINSGNVKTTPGQVKKLGRKYANEQEWKEALQRTLNIDNM